MPRLVPDDSARDLRAVWLGAKGLMRWPVDARFEAWGVALLLTPTLFLVLAFAVPYPVVVAVCSIALGRWVGRVQPGMGWLKNLIIGWVAVVFLLGGYLAGGLAGMVLPMHWVVAFLLAPILAPLLTRRIMRNVEPNRPLGYQARVLLGRATAPRRRRDVAELAVADSPTAADLESLLDDPDPLDLELFRTRLNFRKPVSLRKAPRPVLDTVES